MMRTLIFAASVALAPAALAEPARTGWSLHAAFLIRSPEGHVRPLLMRSNAPFVSEEACARKALELRERVPIGMVATNDGGVVVAVRLRCVAEGRPS